MSTNGHVTIVGQTYVVCACKPIPPDIVPLNKKEIDTNQINPQIIIIIYFYSVISFLNIVYSYSQQNH